MCVCPERYLADRRGGGRSVRAEEQSSDGYDASCYRNLTVLIHSLPVYHNMVLSVKQ